MNTKADEQRLKDLFVEKVLWADDPFSYLSEVPLGGTPPSFRLEAKRCAKELRANIVYLGHIGEEGYVGMVQQIEDKLYRPISLTTDMNLLAGTIYFGQFNDNFYVSYLDKKVVLEPDQNQFKTASPFSKPEIEELETKLLNYGVVLYGSPNFKPKNIKSNSR